jgi:hypothetical protein
VTQLLFPNFQHKRRPLVQAQRVVMASIPQYVYDQVMARALELGHESPHRYLEQLIEVDLGMPEGSLRPRARDDA